MKNQVFRDVLSFVVGVLLTTTYMVLIFTDHLISPSIIKEFISSMCVGLCIGKVMVSIERKGRTKSENKLKKDFEKLLEEKHG